MTKLCARPPKVACSSIYYLDIRSLTPAHLYELNQVCCICSPFQHTGLTENAQSHLEDAVPSSRPAIAELAPLSALRAEYENGSGSFIKQIDFLKAQGYEGIRRSRGDGDCFYRCLSSPESPLLCAVVGVDCDLTTIQRLSLRT